jgi:RNA polymerase sigma factor (TIGR02999 family)
MHTQMESGGGEITRILVAARQGEPDAMDRLLTLVYDDLRLRARRQLRRRSPGQTLDTTSLVHEAYLKLVDPTQAEYRDRCHFFAAAATAMRHILVDRARRHAAQKRGGAGRQVTLESGLLRIEAKAIEVLALDQALHQLAQADARLARLVELRYFGGLTLEETAEALHLSERTVQRDWRTARAFLFRALQEEPIA